MNEPSGTLADRVRPDERLPRGRHGIPRDEVIANQRQRMLWAAASLFVERGYASFAVGDVIGRAQVSRATFYSLFDDKADCVLAAHRAAFEQLDQTLVAACLEQETWPAGVAAAIAAALEFAAEAPAETMLLAFAYAEPHLAKQAVAGNKRLLGMLRAGRERCPEATEPSEVAEHALLLGAVHVIGTELLDGEGELPPRLGADITEILLTPYLGESGARRAATAA